jgi:hypothetical protein
MDTPSDSKTTFPKFAPGSNRRPDPDAVFYLSEPPLSVAGPIPNLRLGDTVVGSWFGHQYEGRLRSVIVDRDGTITYWVTTVSDSEAGRASIMLKPDGTPVFEGDSIRAKNGDRPATVSADRFRRDDDIVPPRIVHAPRTFNPVDPFGLGDVDDN